MLLDGKVAMISGAASPRGIGLATARLFAEHGARVAILDLDARARGEAAAGLGPDIGFGCDVADRGSCERAARPALEAFGQIDILINNAGVTQPVKLMEIDAARTGTHPRRQPARRPQSQPGVDPAHARAPAGLDRLHVVGLGAARRRHFRRAALLAPPRRACSASPRRWRANSAPTASASTASPPD